MILINNKPKRFIYFKLPKINSRGSAFTFMDWIDCLPHPRKMVECHSLNLEPSKIMVAYQIVVDVDG